MQRGTGIICGITKGIWSKLFQCHEMIQPYWGSTWHQDHYSRLYAVLERTLDKDCRQAKEPKQLVDKASRFHLGCQRQHSMVICSGTLLFSSRVLRPSLVTLCWHKSGRCAVELYDVPHLWYPPFYTSPMVSSALQYWTWQFTFVLIIPYEGRLPLTSWWRKSSNMTVGQCSLIYLATIATIDIQEAVVARFATSWHQKSMEA